MYKVRYPLEATVDDVYGRRLRCGASTYGPYTQGPWRAWHQGVPGFFYFDSDDAAAAWLYSFGAYQVRQVGLPQEGEVEAS